MMCFGTRPGYVVSGVVCWVLLSACSVYDEYLLETDSLTGSGGEGQSGAGGSKIVDGSVGGVGGTGGIGGTSSNGGNSGSVSYSGAGSVSGSNEFYPDKTDSSIAPDATVGDACGDGRITGTEKCDIGIANDQPGACPSECPDSDGCVQWQLAGTACEAKCQLITPTCTDGDNCCPADCTKADDSDCSASCGDGIVQTEEGEICEPRAALEGEPDAETLACPTQCEQDDEPCTTVMLTGSEANCSAECSTVEITSVAEGDGCCPNGANANTDSDCGPICGNQIRENDEECDGSESCDDQCRSTLTPEQLTCTDVDAIHSDECKKCVCANCTNEALLCLISGDAAFDEQCAKLLECGERTACAGAYCYCGTALLPLSQTCPIGANGPCKTEIEEAAGTNSVTLIFAQQFDLNTTVGRAFAFSACYQRNCVDICRSDP